MRESTKEERRLKLWNYLSLITKT